MLVPIKMHLITDAPLVNLYFICNAVKTNRKSIGKVAGYTFMLSKKFPLPKAIILL